MPNGNSKRIYLHALTPLHSGTGQSAAIVDLPIAREKATGWPVLPGSGLKGVLRAKLTASKTADAAERLHQAATEEGRKQIRDEVDKAVADVFGSVDQAGPVTLTDLRILCLPVRSFFGTFAWVTSPLVLRRFARDAEALGAPLSFAVPPLAEAAIVSSGTLLDPTKKTLFLEDLDIQATIDAGAAAVANAIGGEVFGAGENGLAERLAIVPDGIFDFLCETGTEIIGRTAIDDATGTAEGGSLRYEEAVPAEAIFCGWAIETRPGFAGAAWSFLAGETTLQIGGNTSVGRGLCRLVVRP